MIESIYPNYIAGLTDYEVRDLNDEINKLLREKRHWENQIVALGGANYRRNVAMLDDDGKEVPGTKGYKYAFCLTLCGTLLTDCYNRYFGRAKELPGVRELFQSKKKEEDEENQAQAYYKKFTNQGPAYFGDLDEADGKLLEFERQAEEEGASASVSVCTCLLKSRMAEWEDAYAHLRQALNLPTEDPIPKLSRPAVVASVTIQDETDETLPLPDGKRKASDAEDNAPNSEGADMSKRLKTNGGVNGQAKEAESLEEAALAHARATAVYIPFHSPESLLPPKMPTREEMEQFLLSLRKKALVEEYFGEQES
jgi:pre-mRNA-splicing factor ISY1